MTTKVFSERRGLFIYLFIYFDDTRDELRAILARQAQYHLSQTPHLLLFSLVLDRACVFA
jgi:hypothetical protein